MMEYFILKQNLILKGKFTGLADYTVSMSERAECTAKFLETILKMAYSIERKI